MSNRTDLEYFLVASFYSKAKKFTTCLYGNRSETRLNKVMKSLRIPDFVTSPYKTYVCKSAISIKDSSWDGKSKLFVGEEIIRKHPADNQTFQRLIPTT